VCACIALLFIDGRGMPVDALVGLFGLMALCFTGRHIALRAQSESTPPRRSVWAVIGQIILGVVLMPFVGIAVVLALVWAHSPSAAEKSLANALQAQATTGSERIQLAPALGADEGTVCLADYGDRRAGRFANIPWAQEAFPGANRSLFAREDYEVFQLALRTPDGKVRLWELPRSSISVVSPGPDFKGKVPRPELATSQPCVPLRSAILLRVHWTPQRMSWERISEPVKPVSAYVLTTSATLAPN
jgi:hypothetical protein